VYLIETALSMACLSGGGRVSGWQQRNLARIYDEGVVVHPVWLRRLGPARPRVASASTRKAVC